MHDKPVALVSGANKGIGRQIAKDLASEGFTVLLGSRQLEAGEAAAVQAGKHAHAVQLDVTDAASIAAAAAHIRTAYGRLDVLVNNAGIGQSGHPDRTAMEMVSETLLSVVDMAELRAVYETNVFGVVALTQAMLPLLREAPAGKIINISSLTGSFALNDDRSNPVRACAGTYTTTKTALNAVTQALAIELEGTNIRVNAVCPGYTATDMSKFMGPGTVEEAAREPVRLALLGLDSPTGRFTNKEGALPW